MSITLKRGSHRATLHHSEAKRSSVNRNAYGRRIGIQAVPSPYSEEATGLLKPIDCCSVGAEQLAYVPNKLVEDVVQGMIGVDESQDINQPLGCLTTPREIACAFVETLLPSL